MKDDEPLLEQYLRLREEWYPWQPNFVSDMINYYRGKDRQDGRMGYDRAGSQDGRSQQGYYSYLDQTDKAGYG